MSIRDTDSAMKWNAFRFFSSPPDIFTHSFPFCLLVPLGMRQEEQHLSLVQWNCRLQWYIRFIYYKSVAFMYVLCLYYSVKLCPHIPVLLFPICNADAYLYLKTIYNFSIFWQYLLFFYIYQWWEFIYKFSGIFFILIYGGTLIYKLKIWCIFTFSVFLKWVQYSFKCASREIILRYTCFKDICIAALDSNEMSVHMTR